jgi:hypothetical protein
MPFLLRNDFRFPLLLIQRRNGLQSVEADCLCGEVDRGALTRRWNKAVQKLPIKIFRRDDPGFKTE